jgi:ankyrin repeat protein
MRRLDLKDLFNACKEGNLDKVKDLHNRGLNVSRKNNFGETALMNASSSGHMHIVKFLLERQVPVDDKDFRIGDTALMNAAFNGHLEIVKTLLLSGASPVAVNFFGDNALIAADLANREHVGRFLLDRGLDDSLLFHKEWKEKEENPICKNKRTLFNALFAENPKIEKKLSRKLSRKFSRKSSKDNKDSKVTVMYSLKCCNFKEMKIKW